MLCLAELDPSPILNQNSITIPPVWIGSLSTRGLRGQHSLGCGVSFPIAGIVILVRNVCMIIWSLDVDCAFSFFYPLNQLHFYGLLMFVVYNCILIHCKFSWELTWKLLLNFYVHS